MTAPAPWPAPGNQPPAPAPGFPGPSPYAQGAVQPPALTATILITFFFDLFGLIPAVRGARRARNVGQPETRYWVAFGATFAASAALYVLVIVVALMTLVGIAAHSGTTEAGAFSASATTAQSGQDAVRARVASIVAAHGPAVAVLSAIDPTTSQALQMNPNDVAALATALGEVAREQGADATEVQAVSQAVIDRAPQLTAVQAIPPDVLATLQADPTDPSTAAAAVGAIMQKLGIGQAQAVQLLTSLASPEVQSDLALVNKYATVLKSAQTDIPAADLAYLQAHAAEVAGSSPTK